MARENSIQQSFYKESSRRITDSDSHWEAVGQRLTWFKPWKKLKETRFHRPVSIQWYLEGKLNLSYNCLDRHLAEHGSRPAIIWEPDEPSQEARILSFSQLHEQVCRFANVLIEQGVKRGDCVTIYLPMIPEAAISMLACARIGAMHSVVFGGFSPDSVVDRMNDGKSQWLVTADAARRGGKIFSMMEKLVDALPKVQSLKKCFVVCTGVAGPEIAESALKAMAGSIDLLGEARRASTSCEPAVMDSEDPLFMLYTSGSTNKPKGVLHTTGGYLAYASYTHDLVFGIQDNDVYWCTADVGWITGHSYVVYGPLSNACTTLMFEGVPHFPDYSRFWQVVDRHQVTVLYTAPTAIRALMKEGDHPVHQSSRKSLRMLGSVGEPINPEAWRWYHDVVGDSRCELVDTWWQTETGGILISALPAERPQVPGSATLPLPGILPELLTTEGAAISGAGEGVLVLKESWPGQMRTVYGDHARFEETYFSTYPGYYFTGDGCRRDEHGNHWISGRVDDVINVAGHRLGTAEIESALVAHPSVAEAAVVAFPHDIKGSGIYAYVTLKTGEVANSDLKSNLIQHVAKLLSPIAKPDKIQWAPGLPKTRSGKIMRRILRKIAEGHSEQLGDISTLADPSVVANLVAGHNQVLRE